MSFGVKVLNNDGAWTPSGIIELRPDWTEAQLFTALRRNGYINSDWQLYITATGTGYIVSFTIPGFAMEKVILLSISRIKEVTQ